jgi:RNA polymerase sigma factor (sigma-70 family)
LEGFDEFYGRVYPRVSAALVLSWSDPDLAADATDEAFVRAFASWERVSRMRSPAGWVFKVALNVARRQARRNQRRRQAEERAAAVPHVPDMPPGAVTELKELLAVLPPRQRVAVILRHVGDLREADIAQAMGIRRGTVASLLTAAHRRLRNRDQATAEIP